MNQDKQTKYSLGELLTAVQILAVLGAAGWSLFLYFRYEATEKRLSNAILRADAVSKVLEQRKVELEIQRADIEIEGLKKAGTVLPHEIEIEDLGAESTSRCRACRRYLVTYSYELTNRGTASVEVTYVLLEAFAADLPKPRDRAEVVAIPPPGGPTSDDFWECLFAAGYYYGPRWTREESIWKPPRYSRSVELTKGGGGTGVVDAAESAGGSVDLVVLRRPGDLVGFRAWVGIDGGKEDENRWYLRNYQPLTAGISAGP